MHENSYLQYGYTGIGLTGDGSSTFYLPRIVGLQEAKRIALLNERISPSEADELGLVTEVTSDEDFDDRLAEIAAVKSLRDRRRPSVGSHGCSTRRTLASFPTSWPPKRNKWRQPREPTTTSRGKCVRRRSRSGVHRTIGHWCSPMFRLSLAPSFSTPSPGRYRIRRTATPILRARLRLTTQLTTVSPKPMIMIDSRRSQEVRCDPTADESIYRRYRVGSGRPQR